MRDESLVQARVLLLECFVAESKLATFLFDCMDKYGSGLDLQETLKAKDQINNIYGLLQRIKSIADKTPPPDKLTVYQGGYPPHGQASVGSVAWLRHLGGVLHKRGMTSR